MTLKSLRFPRLVGLVGIGVLIGAVVFGTVAVNARTDSTQPPADAKISLLERPATAADALPSEVAKSPVAVRFADPAGARLAYNANGRRIYVVPGQEDTLCRVIITGTGANRVIATGCPPRDLVLTDPPVLTYQEVEGGDVLAVAIVPDGFDRASTAEGALAITDNVLSTVVSPEVKEISISGPAGSKTLAIRKSVP